MKEEIQCQISPLMMVDYCPEDPSQSMRCLGNTIHTSVTAGFLLIFGSCQLYKYRKVSTPHRYVDQIGKSKLFNLQICLSLLVPALVLVEFILQSNYGDKFYGFMILTLVLTCVVYPFSTCLILTERYYRLQSVTSRGHGTVLLVFWAIALISENISIIYLQHVEIDVIFFVLRYATLLLILILGLIAPGIVKANDDQDRLLDEDNESNIGDPLDTDLVQSESLVECQIQTTIVVLHRLSTLIGTNEITVFREGDVVEEGRHDELLISNGIYANLWSTQLQKIYSEQNIDDPLEIGNDKKEGNKTSNSPPVPPALPTSLIPSTLPPPPPPIPSTLLPPPPPPLLLSPVLPISSLSNPPVPPPLLAPKKNVPKPGNALKSFNWSKLSDMKIKGTIWSEFIDSKLYANADLLRSIDATFFAYQKNCVDQIDGNTELLEKSRQKNVSVIDGRRAQNCTILLSRLKLSDKEILDAILSMDSNDQIATDMIEQLLKFTPTEEEKLLLEEHAKNTESLVRADRFLYEISQIPDCEQRLKSLLYKKQFTASVNDLLCRITSVTEASRQVTKSEKLKKLLEIVLDIGNYMNYGPRGNASGFHLASLNRLIDTKSSSVKGQTLLHYLVQFIEKEFNHLMSISEEISQVRVACKGSLVEIDKDVAMLRTGLAKTSAYTTAEDFHERATVEFNKLENKFTEMKTRFDEVVRRFGEDGSVMQPDEFFGILNDFLTAFEEARQHNDNLKKIQEDGEKRAKQETELRKCRKLVSESSHFKTDTVLPTDEDITMSKSQKTRLRETRERQNKQHKSLYTENRERLSAAEMDLKKSFTETG